MTNFNPNDPGMANGNFFALPYSVDDSQIILLPVPWDATTSYKPGTHMGPNAIIDASAQVDLYDESVPNAWEIKIGTLEQEQSILANNSVAREHAVKVIDALENGLELSTVKDSLDIVNNLSEELNLFVYNTCKKYIAEGKIIGVVGGDHSVPFGNIKAISEKYEDFGILHIDAHADLRVAYEGFKYSHASILYNCLSQIPQLSQLTQVAIRDYCEQEADIINSDPRIRSFTDIEIKRNLYEGKTWKSICESILTTLPQNIYISIDIDGLSPDLCPNTGTPVPGGLSFREFDYLMLMIANSKKRVIGFDLCEVSPSQDSEWDANVGARVLYKTCIYTHLNNNKVQDK